MTAIETDPPGAAIARQGIPATMSLEIRDRLAAEPLVVRDTLRRIASALGIAGLAADDVAAAELVLAEVLNNVVEHAFRDRRGGTVEVSLRLGTGGLACEVRDDGRPMPCGVLTAPCLPEAEGDGDVPEGGFG